MTLVIAVFQLVFLHGAQAAAKTYTTNFPRTEDPISEGSNWIGGFSVGIDWADVLTTNSTAFGTEMGLVGYDDSTALLTGTWGSNQTCTATGYRTFPSPIEVEFRLRSVLVPHSNTGYEVLFSAGGDSGTYVQIVRWNGPLGSFDLLDATNGTQCIWTNGSRLQATITNSTITAYIDGTHILQCSDTTYTAGNPGIGFYGGVPLNYLAGLTSFTATDGITPPANVLSAMVTNGQFSFFFQTVAGKTYTILQNTDLASTNWVAVTYVQGSGSLCWFTAPMTNEQTCVFFRVREP